MSDDIVSIHKQEQFLGKLVHRLSDSADLLNVGLKALAKGKIEPMQERAEVVLDELVALIIELKRQQVHHHETQS